MKNLITWFCLAMFVSNVAGQSISQKEIQDDYAKGDYRAVMDKTSRVLASKEEQQPSERYKLLMMRGECQLQLKDRAGAIASFKSAAKLADGVNQYASARANTLIVERSSMGRFTPKSGASTEPIDIVPIESRRRAMLALQAEMGLQNNSKIEAALKADTIPVIERVFAPLADMFCLETEAKSQATETGQLMRDLGQHTYRLMQTELTNLSRKIDYLNQLANSPTGGYGYWGNGRRGLISTEKSDLKNIVEYLGKIRDRATEYRGIAGKLGGNDQRWDAMVLDAMDMLTTAELLSNDPG